MIKSTDGRGSQMGGSGETGAQRSERLAAERVAGKSADIAAAQKVETAAQEEEMKKKKAALKKRSAGMQGGGREGLMYQGNQAGVK